MDAYDERAVQTFEVEVSAALAELVQLEYGEDTDVGEWIAKAAEMTLRDRLHDRSDDRALSVDVPEHVAYRAALLAEHAEVHHGACEPRTDPEDWLSEVADVEFRYPGMSGDLRED